MTGYKEYITGLSQEEILNLIESAYMLTFFTDYEFLNLECDEKIKRVNNIMTLFRNLMEGNKFPISLKVHEDTFEDTHMVFVFVEGKHNGPIKHCGSILDDKLKPYLRNRSLENLLPS